jgi:hypothetical protein
MIDEVTGSTTRALFWDWVGDQSVITGFAIFLDGKLYKVVSGAHIRAVGLLEEFQCGQTLRWQVAAVAGQGQSRLSAPYAHRTAECVVDVEVQFKHIHIGCLENYRIYWTCPHCDTVHAWFEIFANQTILQEGNHNIGISLTCGTWRMSSLLSPRSDTIVVPIRGNNPTLRFGSRFQYMNPWGEPRDFQYQRETVTMPIAIWETYDEEFMLWSYVNGVGSHLVVEVRGPKAPP